jgi:peroxiredoxin Q/BCP
MAMLVPESKLGCVTVRFGASAMKKIISRRQIVMAGAGIGVSMFGIKLGYSAENVPAVGQVAPDFTLPSEDGTSISLNQFKGKWVVLYFYPKDGTPGCTIEAHNFQRDIEKYQGDSAVVVGVSVDSADSHKGFCAKQGLTFKLLADTDKKVCAEYGSLRSIMGIKMAARNTFLIDPSGKIAEVWTEVKPGEHSAQVLAALQQLKKK